tara:strand:+ start:367 stop:798 length:432 start_codon:yes stop_codon:yes gene_type:complete
MVVSFKYKTIKRPDDQEVKTPSIPVTLIGNSPIRIEFMALIDSGADLSIIPQDVAELINLDLSGEKDKSRGIGGEVEVVNSKMKIHIEKKHERYLLEVPVQVVLGESKIPIILGREGFFDHFKIIFDQRNERILLKRTTEKFE